MGWIAAVAGLAFGCALAFLAAFFATKDERYDRVAEWSFVVFGAAAIPTILAVAGRLSAGGVAIQAATAVGLAGAAATGLGELGLTLRLLDFRRISPLMTVAFLAVLAWIGAASVLILTGGGLPSNLGWLGVVSIVAGVAMVAWIAREPGVMTGQREPGRTKMLVFFVPMIGLVAWMVWLGASL
jgi:hypothetical protein